MRHGINERDLVMEAVEVLEETLLAEQVRKGAWEVLAEAAGYTFLTCGILQVDNPLVPVRPLLTHQSDYGRIAEPEDIFGSVEVDGDGKFIDGHGRYQPSGTYRMMTRDGIFGLSPFLRERLIERLKVEEANARN